jgi:hypothetical protein
MSFGAQLRELAQNPANRARFAASFNYSRFG